MNNTIFVQIASYRDPELVKTLDSLIQNTSNHCDLRICVAHQYSEEDDFHTDIDKYREDLRFKILDIPYTESKGACWARNQIQQNYNGEEYTLQLDSHHRFVYGWDEECIKMIKDLQAKGHQKPLLTAYLTSYDPQDDTNLSYNPWWMAFDRFTPDGIVFFKPHFVDNYQNLTEPIPARFYSAHFCFTLGQFAQEVQHDPEIYFHGEEISIAVRAYTHGYDLFHPHKALAWHEYTRKGRVKHWDDNPTTFDPQNKIAYYRVRALLGVDGTCSCSVDLKNYGLGTERSLADYERYSGVRFATRAVQAYTLANNYAPNPVIEDFEEYNKSFLPIFRHCVDLNDSLFPLTDYDFISIIFEDVFRVPVYRKDIPFSELPIYKNADGMYNIWVECIPESRPSYQIIFPYSKSQGWTDKITIEL